MNLRQLLDGVPIKALDGDDAVGIRSVTADSRQVEAGSLFVGIAGFHLDGAQFIDAALTKGAAAIVSERPLGGLTLEKRPVAYVEVGDAREALSIIAANAQGRPADKLSLVGVTGTSGKTTTTKMLESIFDAVGQPVGLIGTIEYRDGAVRELADRTTPDAVVLQSWFARMVQNGVSLAVMEVSSHALALKRTYGIRFAAAVFMNMSRDHFDFHTDFEDYYAAKRILFDQIDHGKKSAVVNIDDEYGRRLAAELGSPTVLSFGRGAECAIRPAGDFLASVDGLRGTIVTPAGPVTVRSPLIGTPNLYNWMGAIGAAITLGIEIAAIEKGIEKLAVVRGRFERVPADGATLLVDYAHKPDALEKLLQSVRELAPDRQIVLVFGCGGDRDKGKRSEMGEIAARLADLTLVTSDNPRSERPEAIIEQIEEGLRRVKTAKYSVVPDRRQAIEQAVSMAGDKTVVVVAGKGHENYQVIGDRIVHFDDREEIEAALRKKQHEN